MCHGSLEKPCLPGDSNLLADFDSAWLYAPTVQDWGAGLDAAFLRKGLGTRAFIRVTAPKDSDVLHDA